MSLLRDIQGFENSRLRRVATETVTPDGRRVRQEVDGASHVISEGHAAFVEDTEPDLQVGEVYPALFLGSQDAAANLELLTTLKITHIVNVAANIDNFFPDKFKYLQVQLLDIPETDLVGALPQCFEFIQRALDSEHSRVLVHCNAGVSRSAAVCVAYVMRFGGKSLNGALAEVKQARPSARPNDGFMEQLKQYEKTLEK